MSQHILSLRLDPPHRGFIAPGDILTGQVVLRHFQLSAISRLDVCLTGRAIASCVKSSGAAFGTHHLTSSGLLLNVNKTLVRGEPLPPGDLASWPFSFVIPERVQVFDAQEEAGVFAKSGGFARSVAAHGEAHPVPPTLRSKSEWALEFIHLAIEYQVVARAGISGRVLDAAKSFRIVPLAPADVASLQAQKVVFDKRFRRRSLRLLPEHRERQLGLRDKTRSLLRASTLPAFGFRMHAEVGKYHCMGEKISVRVWMEVNEAESRLLPAQPDVEFVGIEAQLKAQTTFRVETTLGFDVRDKEEVVQMWTVPVHKNFEQAQGFARHLTLQQPPLKKVMPTFATYNIKRDYRMVFQARVRCAEGEFVLKNEFAVVVYGPRREEAEGLVPGPRPEAGHAEYGDDGGAGDDDELPSYESVMARRRRR